MNNILRFLYKNHYFFIFFILEIICFIIISNNKGYQGSKLINSANAVSANVYQISSNTKEYLLLKDENDKLAFENNYLKNRIKLGYSVLPLKIYKKNDTLYRQEYEFMSAKVINSTVNKQYNYITLNVGKLQGVNEDMAVINNQGVIGVVKAVSDNFSSVISILNTDQKISCKIKKEGINGTVKWEGLDYQYCTLIDIPTHSKIKKGDSIVTSSLSGIFPEGIMVGYVDSFERRQNESFYTVKVRLAPDFKKINHVSVIKYINKFEKDSLELKTQVHSDK